MKALLLLLLAATITFAQEVDILGWNKAKWGMTQADVIRELPEAKIHPPDQFTAKPFLAIDHFSIDARHYEIRFAFDETGGLFRVEVIPEGKGGIAANAAKDELLSLLKDKYGTVSSSGTERDNAALSHRWEWVRKHGRIELSYNEYPNWRATFTSLVYYLRKPSDAI